MSVSTEQCLCIHVLSDSDDFAHRQVIQDNFMFLETNMNIDLSVLREAGLINDEESDSVVQSSSSQNVMLLKLFYHVKHADQFDKFLNLSDNQHVHSHICCGHGLLVVIFDIRQL